MDNNLRVLRAERRWTQADLARELNVSRPRGFDLSVAPSRDAAAADFGPVCERVEAVYGPKGRQSPITPDRRFGDTLNTHSGDGRTSEKGLALTVNPHAVAGHPVERPLFRSIQLVG